MTESVPATSQAPAGWYPVDAATVRYWDGQNWTNVTAPKWTPPAKASARRAVTIFVIIVAVLVALAIAGAVVNGTDAAGTCDAYSNC
jgi:hypothetical protein